MRIAINKPNINLRVVLGAVIIGAYIANGIVITVYSVSMSGRSAELREKLERLSEENRSVQSDLYSKTSLSSVYTISDELGYSSNDDLLYLDSEDPVAELR